MAAHAENASLVANLPTGHFLPATWNDVTHTPSVVALRRQQEVDGIAVLVDRTIQIAPLAPDTNVGFVDASIRSRDRGKRRVLGQASFEGDMWTYRTTTSASLLSIDRSVMS